MKNSPSRKKTWILDLVFILVLLVGAVFRFTGIKWDETYHLHPDERFLTMVESSIEPVQTLDEYFDTANSSLNPNNRGYTFYVYGTLPIIIVRYVGEWVGQTGYDQINVVGRVLSGVFDLGTLVFVYLIGKRLYRSRHLGLLAALFSALAVLQIQLSHYFTVDNFANFFTYAAIYMAVCILTGKPGLFHVEEEGTRKSIVPSWLTANWHTFTLFALFGLFYGMALASKVSIWALAGLLPLAAFIYYSRLPEEQKSTAVPVLLRNLVLAGVLAFLTFRIFQPYAFTGPGFLNFKINPNWLASLRELSNLSKGDVDVPYALQWARRPVTFTLKNFVLWGVGIPFGLLSISGLAWMTWRVFKGEWKKHAVLWGWAVFVLITQSLNWVRSMRYILPIYPALALIAAWVVMQLWESKRLQVPTSERVKVNWRKAAAVGIAAVTIAGTALWAGAFTSIYSRPVTRVAASKWIYENIPGAVNLKIETQSGDTLQQPLGYQNSALVSNETPYSFGFELKQPGFLKSVTIEHAASQQTDLTLVSLIATIRTLEEGEVKTAGVLQSDFALVSDNNGEKAVIFFAEPVSLSAGRYQLDLSLAEPGYSIGISGAAFLTLQSGSVDTIQYLPSPVYRLTDEASFQLPFFPAVSGTLNGIQLNRIVDLLSSGQVTTLTASILDPANPGDVLAQGAVANGFLPGVDPRGKHVEILFDRPVALDSGVGYTLQLTVNGAGELGIYGDVPVVESTWDDAIPLGMYGYNQFGYSNGIYGGVRNLELYWDDTATKLDLFYLTLDQSDAIFISSNRQWGTITRVPERYPLTIQYYRALMGCPEDKDLLWCYSVATPGMFTGQLGFDLTAVFQNDPALGKIKINDQFAEEAFTVYDHPKVLIFQKTAAYDQAKVREILGAVDLSKAMHVTPRQAGKFTSDLKLSKEESQAQIAGGTWAELFPGSSLLNRKPWTAAVAWYLTVFLLGLIVYPFMRYFLRGLTDRGYGFSRLAGLLFLAYLTWLAGSLGGQFTRGTIGVILGAMVLVGVVFIWLQRKDIFNEFSKNKRCFLTVEIVMLLFFLLDLAIRIGNPDLWHPWKGGEKPMDLSYFTAVLKSTTFPPYDPWYSGGYINYYYYGFVIVGVLVKFLGIVPDVAYNLIIPTLFALTGLGAFSIGANLFSREEGTDAIGGNKRGGRSLFAGISAALAVLIVGNLGTVRMLWQGLQRMVAPDGNIDGASLFEHIRWVIGGLGKFFTGNNLPYGFGDWYWIPSRAIPGDVITEFPFFTFIYADLHAHMIALPITLLVLGWVLSVLLSGWNWKTTAGNTNYPGLLGSILLGGFLIGTLRPTNTWDLPTFLLFAGIVVFYSSFRYAELPGWLLPSWPDWVRRGIYSGFFVLVLAGFAILCYQPFVQKYAQAYGSVDSWKGEHSRLSDYLVHWGWQFFLIISWLAWETREWLAGTPLSAVRKWKPYLGYLQVVGALILLVIALLIVLKVHIGWFVGLLGIWTFLLLLRQNLPDSKRLVLFMIGTGLLLTLFVELFALQGDIGRMNTVFKFYFQSWTLFSLSAAACLVWLAPAVLRKWKPWVANAWQVLFVLLVFSALLYPVTAATDKIRDRMSTAAPAGLDGTAFMQTSRYYDQGIDMDLNQDYQAIQWLRQNVQGSPIIMETNTVEYRWGNRYTIYTGLPGVLGWNWHQRQQRGAVDYNGIAERLIDIPLFYQTENINDALSILKKYDVSYIIVGQMEKAYYPGAGLDKFARFNGEYWKKVFDRDGTTIYEVITD